MVGNQVKVMPSWGNMKNMHVIILNIYLGRLLLLDSDLTEIISGVGMQVAGYVHMPGLAKSMMWRMFFPHWQIHCLGYLWGFLLIFGGPLSKVYSLVNYHSHGQSPLLVGISTRNGPFSIASCEFPRLDNTGG